MSKYEFNEYIIAPGETILELLEVNCMSQLDLAIKLGMSKKTINEIIQGKAAITPLTALKLEYVFNISSSFWNNLESNYRDALIRKKDMDSIIEDTKYLDSIPYLEMSKRNWDFIEMTRDPIEKVINLRKFFSVSSLSFNTYLKQNVAFRKSDNKNFSKEALCCWLRYGEIQTIKETCPKFNVEMLKNNVTKIRELACSSFMSQYNCIKELLRECGICLVYEALLPNTNVNGVTYKISCDRAIIMISDKGKKDDILWFTLFHEIAHLIKHSKKGFFIDFENSEINSVEKEADEYARNILIPDFEYCNFVKKGLFTSKLIKDFSKINNISPGIVVGRLQKDGLIKWNQFNELITRI